jgi:hypothetical protein
MPSPTGGSSAPIADSAEINGNPFTLKDGIPAGTYTMQVINNDLDARVKCAKCESITFHIGQEVESVGDNPEQRFRLRIYTCTVCGVITSKRA